ncbi:MAG: hypothetical protein BWY57_03250 [Betaproteobacteria bacterium ADurb.Bin341]|nr:MAG: hypothetical protein BWY57_03250 [Betaproteobacteria bacterium ADurb.Bin341]
MADRFGTHLAGQIDFEGGVDRHLFLVVPDHVGVVHPGTAHDGDGRVVVDEVVETLRAEREGGDHLAGQHARIGSRRRFGDGASLVEVQHAVGEHLGMDRQTLLVQQFAGNGVGNAADAKLDTGAVLDQVTDIGADLAVTIIRVDDGQLRQGIVVFDQEIDVVEVDHRVAVSPRRLSIHFQNDEVSRFHHLALISGGKRQGNEAEAIRRRAGAEKDIGLLALQRIVASGTQVARNAGTGAQPGGGAGTDGIEPGAVHEMPLHRRVGVPLAFVQGQTGRHADVPDTRRNGVQLLQDAFRFSAGQRRNHKVVRMDFRQRFFDADQFVTVVIRAGHVFLPADVDVVFGNEWLIASVF